jgi:hypothetical protein
VEHLDPDEIVLMALGEQDASHQATPGAPQFPQQHLLDCAVCREELRQLTRTVELAREAGELGLQIPVVLPASIWNGIAGELGIGAAPDSRADLDDRVPPQRVALSSAGADRAVKSATASRTGGRHLAEPGDVRPRLRGRVWRRGLVTAAVVVLLGVGVGVGVAVGRHHTAIATASQSQAVLKAMPAGPPTAHGTATVTQGESGTTLTVAARQLPLRQGYYEVWLYNPQADKMIAVGTLGSGGDGIWTLASTIDLRSYSVVDVSAQDFDGNPAHKDSVLQGPLTQ